MSDTKTKIRAILNEEREKIQAAKQEAGRNQAREVREYIREYGHSPMGDDWRELQHHTRETIREARRLQREQTIEQLARLVDGQRKKAERNLIDDILRRPTQ